MDWKVNTLTSMGDARSDAAEVIESMGRICYRSEEKITPDSAAKFMRMILGRGHESVIEHSWFNFTAHDNSFVLADELLRILTANGLLVVTPREEDPKKNFLIGGNARMFRDLYRQIGQQSPLTVVMLNKLKEKFPVLFGDLPNIRAFGRAIAAEITLIEDQTTIAWSPLEKLRHWWAAAVFEGCSRAFTHQLVRHRHRVAISQESQRYCDESGFFGSGYYVTPPSIDADFKEWYEERLRQIDADYQRLIALLEEAGNKKVREDARFLLPNAVCSKIGVSCPLMEWRWILHMRCDAHAQWEIRRAAMSILQQFQEAFPGCFDDFDIAPDGESASWREDSEKAAWLFQ